MKLHRTQSGSASQFVRTDDSQGPDRDSRADIFTDEILRTLSGLLKVIEATLKLTDKNASALASTVKMDLCELLQSLLNTRPQNVHLGQWEDVFTNRWQKDQSSGSSQQSETQDEIAGACYSFHPEINDFTNREPGDKYRRRFNDMNAFIIVAVKEFKPDLDNIIQEVLYAALFLQAVIETLTDNILTVILEPNERRKITEIVIPQLSILDTWWENSSFLDLKDQIYHRAIPSHPEFIQDVINKGLLSKLYSNFLLLLQQSKRRLAAVVQLHPHSSRVDIHAYHHNAVCLYFDLQHNFMQMKSLIIGSDEKNIQIPKCGFNYVCENVILRFQSKNSHQVIRKRNYPIQTRNRAKSADMHPLVLDTEEISGRHKSGAGAIPTFQPGSNPHVYMRSPRSRLSSKSSTSPDDTTSALKWRSRSGSSEHPSNPGQDSSQLQKLSARDTICSNDKAEQVKEPVPKRQFSLNLLSLQHSVEAIIPEEPSTDNSQSCNVFDPENCDEQSQP